MLLGERGFERLKLAARPWGARSAGGVARNVHAVADLVVELVVAEDADDRADDADDADDDHH